MKIPSKGAANLWSGRGMGGQAGRTPTLPLIPTREARQDFRGEGEAEELPESAFAPYSRHLNVSGKTSANSCVTQFFVRFIPPSLGRSFVS